MAHDIDLDGGENGEDTGVITDTKADRPKPTKSLPTERVSMEKQWLILRAVAKASLAIDRGSVSNADVARYASVNPNTVSNCNGFWIDAGIVTRDGNKIRPVDAVFEFDQAAEWNPETAPTKLGGVLAASWFGKAILTKLAIKPTTMSDAVAFLAQECRASTEYKDQLEAVMEYLRMGGLIVIDGTTVSKAAIRADHPPPPPPLPLDPANKGETPDTKMISISTKSKQFAIPIPDKGDAIIVLPNDLDEEDWEIALEFLQKYVMRWKKFPAKHSATGSQVQSDPTRGTS